MRRLILSACACALVALISVAAFPAGAASGSLALCDTATGTFQVTGTGFTPGAQLVVWDDWDPTAGIGEESRAVTADATGQFETTFSANDLPTTLEVTDAAYDPVAGPFTAGAIGPCSTTAGLPSTAASTVTPAVDPPQLPADGVSRTTIVVQLRNADRVPLTKGGAAVTVSTTAGALAGGCTTGCATLDNGDGTYTATLTAARAPATATVTGFIDGAPIAHTAAIGFTQLVLDPPQIDGPAGASTSAIAQFTFAGANTGAAYVCSLDGAPYSPCVSPYTTPSLPDGPHSLSVEQTLNALTSTAATFQWTISTPPAVPTIATSPNAITASPAATFAFTGAASGATFSCSLDNAPFTPCKSPIAYGGLAAGPHTFSVEQVKDGVASVPATFAWTIDTTPPATPTLTASPSASSASTSVSFSFTGEAGATFQCSLDGTPYSTCVSGVEYTGLAAGSHTFSVEAVDLAGNVGPATSDTFAVVQQAPAGCNREGSIAATQTWKSGSDGSAKLVSVAVYADCAIDRASGTVSLRHLLLVVLSNGASVLTCSQEVTKVTFSGPDAVATGTYRGVPFTVSLHDGGPGDGHDLIRVEYGSLDTSDLSTTHGAVTVVD